MNEDGSSGSCCSDKRRQLDSGHPSFGPFGQGMDVVAGQIEAVVAHEGADVLLFQPEVSVPDLSQLAPGSPTLDRQNGIDAGTDDDMRSRREPLDKGGEPAKSGGSDDVQVIEDEPRGAGPQSQLVDQRGHDVSDVVGTLDEKVERIGGASWLDGGERSSDGRPEPELVMIPPIAREPGAPSFRSLCDPGRQQHGFAHPWAAGHQRAGELHGRIQPAEKVGPSDQGVRQGGSDELRHGRLGADHLLESTKAPPNHPGEGDDVRGGTDHNDQGRWNQPPT